ncbi:MAG: carbamoyltransferase N-terminal domain-containing protein, partial [Armatimonadota bacterium]
MKRYYVGLAATLHDSALAIVDPSGEPVFAEATERYLQCKRAYNCPPDDMIRIPELVREYCEPDAELMGAVTWSTLFLSRLNYASTSLSSQLPASRDLELLSWPLPDTRLLALALRNSISQASLNLASSRRIPNRVAVRYYDHHLTHAATAVCTGPFERCTVAVVDGYGEGSSTAFYHYDRGKLTYLPGQSVDIEAEAAQFASLGHFYGRLCSLCGFDPIKGEEWKVMGLAAYGKHDPKLYELLSPMIRVDGLTLRPGVSNDDLAARLRRLRSVMRPPTSSPLEAAD